VSHARPCSKRPSGPPCSSLLQPGFSAPLQHAWCPGALQCLSRNVPCSHCVMCSAALHDNVPCALQPLCCTSTSPHARSSSLATRQPTPQATSRTATHTAHHPGRMYRPHISRCRTRCRCGVSLPLRAPARAACDCPVMTVKALPTRAGTALHCVAALLRRTARPQHRHPCCPCFIAGGLRCRVGCRRPRHAYELQGTNPTPTPG
jgi:hypothetical protein